MMIAFLFFWFLVEMQNKPIIERRLYLLLVLRHCFLLLLLMKCLSILENVLNAHPQLIPLNRPLSLLLMINLIKHLKQAQSLDLFLLCLLHLAIIKYFLIKLAYKSFHSNHKYKNISIHILSMPCFCKPKRSYFTSRCGRWTLFRLCSQDGIDQFFSIEVLSKARFIRVLGKSRTIRFQLTSP